MATITEGDSKILESEMSLEMDKVIKKTCFWFWLKVEELFGWKHWMPVQVVDIFLNKYNFYFDSYNPFSTASAIS